MPGKVKTQSPIKRRPLPTAGRSLDRRVSEVLYETVGTWVAIVAAMAGMIFWEWAGYIFNYPRSPWSITFVGLFMLALVSWRIPRSLRTVKLLKLGREGEMAVGQFLERMRTSGYQVFHDLPGDEKGSWNIDHVLVGPGGIFAIETKTVSKMKGRHNVISYEGGAVRINGHEPERNPVRQAKASAARIREVLLDLTGREIAVRPVLVYPTGLSKDLRPAKTCGCLSPRHCRSGSRTNQPV